MIQRFQQKEARKAQIIAAAARVFANKGFTGTAIAEIAIEAGIGKGTIYEYFESKEDLFFAVFQWLNQKIASAATVRISTLGGSVSERLVALNDSLMNSWLDVMDMYSLVMEFWAASSASQMRKRFKQAFKQAYRAYRSMVNSLIREGIERGEFISNADSESVAAALVGTWDALLLQAWFEDSFDPLTKSKDFLTVLLRGLAAEKR
jgi:AcrR family transcriptional regulator